MWCCCVCFFFSLFPLFLSCKKSCLSCLGTNRWRPCPSWCLATCLFFSLFFVFFAVCFLGSVCGISAEGGTTAIPPQLSIKYERRKVMAKVPGRPSIVKLPMLLVPQTVKAASNVTWVCFVLFLLLCLTKDALLVLVVTSVLVWSFVCFCFALFLSLLRGGTT